jgi:hypothetical protein
LVVEAVADDRLPRGTAVMDFNQPGEGAADLIDAAATVTDVRLESANQPARHRAGDDARG